MIDLSSFCCVELNNYIKHQHNCAKIINAQKQQINNVSNELEQIETNYKAKLEACEQEYAILQQLSNLQEQDLTSIKDVFSKLDSATKITKSLILSESKLLIETIITNLFDLEIDEIEGMYQGQKNQVLFVFMVELNYDMFKNLETKSDLTRTIMKKFYHKLQTVKDVEIKLDGNGQYLEIEVLLLL